MKNRSATTIFGAILVSISLLASVQLRATASDEGGERNLEGTWITSVTPVDCVSGNPVASAFPGILSFHKGGTMSGTSSVAPTVFGIWERTGSEYKFAFTFLRYNSSGVFIGRQTVHQKVSLALEGGEFTSTGSVEILDAGGNVIGNGCAASTGVRFQ